MFPKYAYLHRKIAKIVTAERSYRVRTLVHFRPICETRAHRNASAKSCGLCRKARI